MNAKPGEFSVRIVKKMFTLNVSIISVLTEYILQGTLDLVKYTAKLGPMGFFKVDTIIIITFDTKKLIFFFFFRVMSQLLSD